MDRAGFVAKLKELGLPVFSIETASGIIQKPAAYTSVYLNRLSADSVIKLIERGKYCLPGTDEYTLASRIVPFSYITGRAALEHYRLTTQIATTLQVIASVYHRPIVLPNYRVEFSKVKKEFIYGYAATTNGPIFAEPEKIFIDDVYLHRKQYYTEEFEYAIRSGRLDAAKLKRYAQMSNSEHVQRIIAIRLGEMPRAAARTGKRIRV